MDLVVVLPVARPDFALAVKWLKWVKILDVFPGMHRYDLIVFCAQSLPVDARLVLEHEIENTQWCLEVHPDDYEHPEYGYAAAANSMFRGALECVEDLFPGRPMLWCEADTTPMHERWFQEIEKEYNECGKPFLGDWHLDGAIPHLTGNAVYPADWRVQAPSLALLPQPAPHQGWDSLCAPETLPKSARSKRIQQLWIIDPTFSYTEADVNEKIRPETALFHRCKDGSVIDVLTDRLGLDRILLGPSLAPYNNQLPYGGSSQFKVDILIVTYARDIEFLKYCLRSIHLFGAGFQKIHVVVPRREEPLFSWIPKNIDLILFDEIPGKGMLQHLALKCRADELCPNAQAILHVDPDCIFWEPFAPDDYLDHNRPLIVREEYSKVLNHHRKYWQVTVKNAIGLDSPWETMVRHPQIHLPATYRRVRQLVEKKHNRPFTEYVLDGQNEFPQTFCEFNTLGAVALAEYPGHYFVMEYDRNADAEQCNQDPAQPWQYIYRKGRDKLIETWSHAGFNTYEKILQDIITGKSPEYFIK